MTFDFNLLDPRNAAIWLPMDGSFRQDVGANLVTDGDMESPDVTPPWLTDRAGLVTKEVIDPYVGAQNIKLAYTSAAYFNVRQDVMSASRTYHFALAARSGAALPWRLWNTSGTWVYPGVPGRVSVAWEYVSDVFLTDSVGFYLGSVGGSAGQYVEFDAAELYERPIVTRSLSRAQNYARLGDGHAAATMPTLLPRRGYSFDGGDYINLDWAAGGALDTQTFTVCSLVAPTIPVADGRIYEIGIAGARYSLFYDLSEGDLVWQKDDVVDQTITSGYGYPDGSAHVVCASISSTAMNLYVDDRLVGSLAGDLRLASFNAASKAYFGQDVAGGNLMKGKMFGGAVYPFELTLAQVREWGRRARQMRNL